MLEQTKEQNKFKIPDKLWSDISLWSAAYDIGHKEAMSGKGERTDFSNETPYTMMGWVSGYQTGMETKLGSIEAASNWMTGFMARIRISREVQLGEIKESAVDAAFFPLLKVPNIQTS